MNTTRRNTRVAGTLLAAVGTALMVVSAPALANPPAEAPTADPPGNNGTVKIDGVDFDAHPNNEPHPGCTFQVDFYNFDEGVGDATVTFTMIAPTADVGLSVAGDTSPDIGEDPADGTVDAQVTYVLSFDGEPHPVQGYHVKLTVNAPGSIGKDTKHKVFWVTECDIPTTSTTSTTETTTTETTTTETTTTETTETSTTETSTTETTSTVPSSTLPTTSETTETTVPSSTLPTTSETTETTVPSSTLPTTSESTSPVESTSPPTRVAPSTSQSPAGPGAPTDFQAGLPGQQPTAATPGGEGRSPWALAGFFGGLAMAGTGVTMLIRRPAGDAL